MFWWAHRWGEPIQCRGGYICLIEGENINIYCHCSCVRHVLVTSELICNL